MTKYTIIIVISESERSYSLGFLASEGFCCSPNYNEKQLFGKYERFRFIRIMLDRSPIIMSYNE